MNTVTGSFGYIGKYITRQLLQSGETVQTITTHPDKVNPFGEAVKAFHYNFDHPDQLTETLRGSQILYNTYWVRFNYQSWSFDEALNNTKILFDCAKKAGIQKIVHISVTNCLENDDLPYYRGKAFQEKALIETGIPYVIVRPTLVFGKEDILVNNIAWTIRTFPVIPVFGRGDYRVQPVFVGDLAEIAIAQANQIGSNRIDAIGPETFTYQEFLALIAANLERKVRLVHLSPRLGIFLGNLIGLFVKDVVLTSDELKGLMGNKLTSQQNPNGHTKFTEWLVENRDFVGRAYTSELDRHFRWRRTA